MKRLIALMMCAVSLGAAAQLPDYVPTDGLIGWWALDGNAVCEIDGIDDGLVLGPTATENRFGVQASAFSFDGNDRLEISDQTELRPESFTVSIWAWVDAANGQIQQLVAKNAGNGPYESVDVVRRNDNSLMGNIGGPDFWGTWIYDSSNEFPPGQWNHVVYSFDDSLNHQALYQNGVLIASGGVFDSIEYDSLPWTLGAEREGGVFSWWLVGKLDDFGLWNRALSSAEVSELFNWTPFGGCTNPTACNFNAEAQVDDGSCISAGCTDSYACNFDSESNCDDGSCDYSCCPGPGCCSQGLFWDWELGQCFSTNPADINNDGCVQLNDLLDLLSAYGDCAAEESPWQCGDPLEYQGYDYETVQIGEQCWFAENLRAENYRNGDVIPADLSPAQWSNSTQGALATYGQGEGECYTASPDGDACDEEWSLNEFGRYYNWYAVTSDSGLCPISWHVPSDEDWMQLEQFLGLIWTGNDDEIWMGDDQGQRLKSTYGWQNNGNGTNETGFEGLPAGGRTYFGSYGSAGGSGYWWTSSELDPNSAWLRTLYSEEDRIGRFANFKVEGYSIRCLKD